MDARRSAPACLARTTRCSEPARHVLRRRGTMVVRGAPVAELRRSAAGGEWDCMPISPEYLPSELRYIIPLAERHGSDARVAQYDRRLGRHVQYGETVS